MWLGLLFAACGGDEVPPPVLLVGVDGFEWEVLLPLVERGEVPFLRALMERGTYGKLETIEPTLSPVIWTTMATGRPPEEHGIYGFVADRAQRGEERRLLTNRDRRTKAFWNILSEYGVRQAIVGWWMTSPVEPIDGVMVAQVNTLGGIAKGGLVEGYADQVFPEARAEEFLAIHRETEEEIDALVESIFGAFEEPVSAVALQHWNDSKWAFRCDATYLRISERLATGGFDLLALYLGGADVLGHRFWRHLRPEEFAHPPSAEEIERLGGVIPDYYRFIDRSLARLAERMPAETTVILVADHGMEVENADGTFQPGARFRALNSGHHHDAPPGVFLAAGWGVKDRATPLPTNEAELAAVGSVYDLAPTLLARFGVPLGADLRGRPLPSVAIGRSTVETHASADWLEKRFEQKGTEPPGRGGEGARSGEPGEDEMDAEDEAERLKQLRSLGYVD